MPKKSRSNRTLQAARHRNQSRVQHRRQLLRQQRRREQSLLFSEPALLPGAVARDHHRCERARAATVAFGGLGQAHGAPGQQDSGGDQGAAGARRGETGEHRRRSKQRAPIVAGPRRGFTFGLSLKPICSAAEQVHDDRARAYPHSGAAGRTG